MKEGQNQQISEFKIQNVRTYNEVISSQDDWSLTRQDTHNKPNPEFEDKSKEVTKDDVPRGSKEEESCAGWI